MKKCNICGAPLDDDALFCTNCGKKIEPQGRKCPQCGAEVDTDSIFCSKCGIRIDFQMVSSVNPNINNAAVYKKRRIWWIVGAIVVVLFLALGGYYAYQKNNIKTQNNSSLLVSDKNLSSSKFISNAEHEIDKDNNCRIELFGDADGFPLTLSLNIISSKVKGTYKNIRYGTTMTVTGTLENEVIKLTGSLDQAIYEFTIVPEGSFFTGTFSQIGGRSLKLHLTKR